MSEHHIERLGHLGDGVAEGPIYVARALPGEIVSGEVKDGRIAQPKILRPSDNRIRAGCRHYNGCGGCALQHATDQFVADWKCDVVRSALSAQNLPAPIRKITTSPPNSRRRAVLSGTRLKSGALVGFHAKASDTIVEVSDCTVLHPDILAKFSAFEALTQLGASRKSEIRLTTTVTLEGIDLAVTQAKPLDRASWERAVKFTGEHDLARLTWNGETVLTLRPPRLRMGGTDIVPPPGAFLQATSEGERALCDSVLKAVGDATTFVDLFSGIGTFSLPLARKGRVHAVEGEAEMLAALDQAWRQGEGLKPLSTETRDLFRRPLEPVELGKFEAAVIDPPRAGAEAQMHTLAKDGPDRIAMVSCNPVTFARDAQILVQSGYEMNWIDVVDQFRWSPHIELVSMFSR